MQTIKDKNVERLTIGNKEIILVGTAHVSRESTLLVKNVIEEEKPDTVCVELCDSRYQSLRQKDRWQNMDIIKVIREKKSFLLLSNLMLASFQKRIAEKLDVKPGQEMITAIETAEAVGAEIHLGDRDIRITLSRCWRVMSLWNKIKIFFQMTVSMAGGLDDISEQDIEKMKQKDILETLLTDVGKTFPGLRRVLIDERDQYLCHRIRNADGNKIVAVVGAGHVPGITQCWERDIDTEVLEKIPPKGKMTHILKWLVPLAIMGLIALGFFRGGTEAGTDMMMYWIMVNGVLAGIGAIVALAHPITILSAVVAAPLTSLNPMIAAGWVSGLVEAFLRKPKVRDFETLSEDMGSLKGFWKNKVTRVLLVTVLTNVGSAIGTYAAIPLMVKVISG